MESRKLEIASSSKGKQMLSIDGFLFHFSKDGVEKKIWVCDQYRTNYKCPARLHTTDSRNNPRLINMSGIHSHQPNPVKVDVNAVMANIRTTASATLTAPNTVIANCVADLPAASQGGLPSLSYMKNTIRHARCVATGSLKIPHTRAEILLPEQYQLTSAGKNFVLSDPSHTVSANGTLIFGTMKNLEFLQNCDLFLVDGTFKSSPALFDQLFVIHGYRNGTTFPLVFCLSPNRQESTYASIIEHLKLKMPGLAPRYIMSDYEAASINAFSKAFPLAENKGCYFHYSQCIFRNIQSRPDVLHKYSTDAEFNLMIRHIVVLAFLPPQDVSDTFDLLMEEPFFVLNEALLVDFIQYYERTWLGPWNRRRSARIPPLFSVELWNCYQSVLDGLPKTNNSCEGFHHGFSSLLGATHPTIYKLIDGLKSQQVMTELKINQFYAGNIPPPKKKYKESAGRLQSIVHTYADADYDAIEYLRKLAYCITG